MAKKKSISLGAIILTAIALVGAVLTITGLFLNWTKYSVESVLLNKEYQYTLKDLAETNSNLGDNGFKMFGAMNAFAYITMILALVSFASVALAKFLNMKLIKPVAACGASDDPFHHSFDRFRVHVLLQKRGLLFLDCGRQPCGRKIRLVGRPHSHGDRRISFRPACAGCV